jgi:hypothetical protein
MAGIKMLIRSACFVIFLALAAAASPARAGSDALGGPDDHDPDEGPPFWGFVKDESGRPVRDAKVSASYQKLTLVTRTNATGGYKVRGFKKGINISDVVITCAKDGYKQVRTFRRPPPRGKALKSVETECRLQRVS